MLGFPTVKWFPTTTSNNLNFSAKMYNGSQQQPCCKGNPQLEGTPRRTGTRSWRSKSACVLMELRTSNRRPPRFDLYLMLFMCCCLFLFACLFACLCVCACVLCFLSFLSLFCGGRGGAEILICWSCSVLFGVIVVRLGGRVMISMFD